MLFSSIVFLFAFLPAVVILYYLLPVRFRNVILLLASLVFYAWGEPVYLFLMLLSILFNYFSGLDIARNLQDKRAAKRSLVFNLIINLAVLGFFKYEGFVLDTLNGILPVHISYHALPLPIGISFYTFQILSYIIDVYRGNVKVQTNLPNFALYVTMFPQLIAGPIVQYADVCIYRSGISNNTGFHKKQHPMICSRICSFDCIHQYAMIFTCTDMGRLH